MAHLLQTAAKRGSELSRLRRLVHVAVSHLASLRDGEGYWSLVDGLYEAWTLGGFYGETGEATR